MPKSKIEKNTKAELEKLKKLLNSMPDAFTQHPELLELLTLQDSHAGAVNVASLLERQISVLKSKIAEQRQQTLAMIQNAKHNEFITDRLFKITHELTACVDIDDVFDVLYQDTLNAFDIDFLSIKITREYSTIESSKAPQLPEINADYAEDEGYQNILEQVHKGTSLCGARFPDTVTNTFFHDHQEDLASAAFVPLIKPHDSTCFGILGLGSKQQEKFSNKLSGTLHLDRLGTLAATAIDRIFHSNINKH